MITSKPTTEAYRSNWDETFGSRQEDKDTAELPALEEEPAVEIKALCTCGLGDRSDAEHADTCPIAALADLDRG